MAHVALRNFAMVNASGATVYLEGQTVPDAIAKLYPEHIVGLAKEERLVVHNPYLKEKPTKKEIAKMTEKELKQWLTQFHPGECPAGTVEKAELAAIVAGLVE